jgi:hypothetical protein
MMRVRRLNSHSPQQLGDLPRERLGFRKDLVGLRFCFPSQLHAGESNQASDDDDDRRYGSANAQSKSQDQADLPQHHLDSARVQIRIAARHW